MSTPIKDNWKSELTEIITEALRQAAVPVHSKLVVDIVDNAVERFCEKTFLAHRDAELAAMEDSNGQ